MCTNHRHHHHLTPPPIIISNQILTFRTFHFQLGKIQMMIRARIKNIVCEIHMTGCIVSQSIGHSNQACALINPTNEDLVGTAASYFPVGRRANNRTIEQQGFNSWGGLDIGSDQLYATQVVDGRVSMFGGESLSRELEKIPFVSENTSVKVKPGNVTMTSATEQLKHNFKNIIHAVAPYPSDDNASYILQNCYINALHLARKHDLTTVVTPLLGNGQRGFDDVTSVHAAVNALERFSQCNQGNESDIYLCFGLIDDSLVDIFEESFNESSSIFIT